MRLFNRRKESMEFDDPQLVGMAPLCTPEESFGPLASLPTLHEDSATERLGRTKTRSMTPNGSLGTRLQPSVLQEIPVRDPSKSSSNGISTWSKKVGRTWDSLRRTESTERLNCSSLSSTSNRRKTLHFLPESEWMKSTTPAPVNKSEAENRKETENNTKSSNTNGSNNNNNNNNVIITGTNKPAPRRKIGRVESLRNLLSKTHRIRANIRSKVKVDKGTDTQDLEPDEVDVDSFEDEDDEVFDSFLQHKKSQAWIKDQSHILKTTSCENLTTKRGEVHSTGTQLDATSNYGTMSKRSSFPYAYIRSKLTSLPEESPSPQQQKLDKTEENDRKIHSKQFYHSMGNLLSQPLDESEKEEKDEDTLTEPIKRKSKPDPLAQIRIDLIHKNPSDLDDPNPNLWGRRSFSIGDILSNRKEEVDSESAACSNHR
ncbi:unnamed protein product [Allacma fusca]|uniref:Uncharacterized protein n=1 Tax=Allacma fusca TaxID=39272 RepID=A0A8J2P7M6_9HEXA|nr:unnamed protein product [Allacma fusca]